MPRVLLRFLREPGLRGLLAGETLTRFGQERAVAGPLRGRRGVEVGAEAQFHASCFPSHRAHTIRSRGNAISLMEKVALGKGVDEPRAMSTEAVSCHVY